MNAGYARLDSIMTAQGFEDYDGKMNVWYRTNKTPSDYTGDIDKANATVDDGHVNPWIAGDTRGEDSLKNDPDGDGRVIDYTGWRLWEKDVPTTAASKLNVADLKLDSDEYVTAFRFEYGRVEKGFTTRTSAWDRDAVSYTHLRIRKKYISRLYIAIIAIFVCAFAGLGENISANAGQPDSFTGSASIVITNRGCLLYTSRCV